MPRISINDGSLYYERHGAGFPVMMISGLGGLGSFWNEQVAALSKRYECITHDSRGVGESDPIRGGYTVDRMAGDVIALMDRLEIERAHLMGHSTGGAIAQTLAIEHPNRVASIVLSATWTKPDAYFRRMYGLRKEVLHRLGASAYVQATTLFLYPSWWIAKNNEKLRHVEAQNLAHFPPLEIAMSRIDAILAFDRTQGLAKIRTPTLVVGAEDDIVTPAYFSEELARLIRGAEVKIFPRGGHWFPHVLAREFNQAVLPFLNSHTPAGSLPDAAA
ncbi:MAG TPA: alpha/beta fold hydrolase [Stellaceae bacterium]|jgi:aminoacrylate hydrolase|nr:alpha/beta fold hydrolase [Stellaceae bacterium]